MTTRTEAIERALRKYQSAGVANSTCFETQSEAREMAHIALALPPDPPCAECERLRAAVDALRGIVEKCKEGAYCKCKEVTYCSPLDGCDCFNGHYLEARDLIAECEIPEK